MSYATPQALRAALASIARPGWKCGVYFQRTLAAHRIVPSKQPRGHSDPLKVVAAAALGAGPQAPHRPGEHRGRHAGRSESNTRLLATAPQSKDSGRC